MAKRIRNYPLYLAPGINSFRNDDGVPIVIDEETAERLDPNNIEDKIKIYKRQVKGWFLDCANRLKSGKNNGFIVLMIAVSYIEGVQQYRNGQTSNGQSRATFVQGLRRIFPDVDLPQNRANDFYHEVRCGLFHNGMSEGQVVISNEFNEAIDFSETDTIRINPKVLLSVVRDDFQQYITLLRDRDNNELRQNFDFMFSNL